MKWAAPGARLETLFARSFGNDSTHGREHAGQQCELIGAEVRAAVGNLAEKDRQDCVESSTDRTIVRSTAPAFSLESLHPPCCFDALGDRGGDVADDAGVERARLSGSG